MKMGSLFAGIGGFDLGFERAGFEVAWHAEIDRAASAILAYRWPNVPNLGDVTKIDGAAIPFVDVICGGFPCQDLSVAGKRRGFEGERSVLAFEFLRIVREMREATHGRAPAFVVLENVPGLFSSAGGRDFGALLDALGELGPMDIAWRVLDSRYFGVAQRRRRVFVVVDFGGERCDEILALTEGLRGDSPARGAAREDVAHALTSRPNASHREDSDTYCPVVSPALKSRDYKGPSSDGDGDGAPLIVSETVRSHPRPGSNSVGLLVAHSLRVEAVDAGEDGTGRGTPLVPILADPISAHEQSTYTHEGKNNFRLRNVIPFDERNVTSPDNRSRCIPGEPSHTLHSAPPSIAFRSAQTGANGIGVAEEVAYTLDGATQGVSFGIRNDAARDGEARTDSPDAEGRLRKRDAGFNVYREEAPTLDATAPHGVGSASGVRRLTPRECERLQGFPDSWTAIPGMADGPRYKCLGNAVTVNVAEWIARRIVSTLPAPDRDAATAAPSDRSESGSSGGAGFLPHQRNP